MTVERIVNILQNHKNYCHTPLRYKIGCSIEMLELEGGSNFFKRIIQSMEMEMKISGSWLWVMWGSLLLLNPGLKAVLFQSLEGSGWAGFF